MNNTSVHLTRAGVSLVLSPTPSGEPSLLHWGAALDALSDADLEALARLHRPGVPHSAVDLPRQAGLLAQSASGFTGLPALEGFRPDATAGAVAPHFTDWAWELEEGPPADAMIRLMAADDEAGWAVVVRLGLTREGLVTIGTRVTNVGVGELVLTAVRCALPVGTRATELLDLTGRWCRERSPQRRPWLIGTHLREGRHGRTGHDATLLLAAGQPGFGFRHGDVWATHVAWSGDHAAYAERTPEGECRLGGGELLGPGEIRLGEGECYESPLLVGSFSSVGLDTVGERYVAWVRRQHGDRPPRPVLVNTWEAVYFDHDLVRLTSLADAAAAVGAERFVLDDGWFRGRRHDRAGLGDWTVDPEVWPQGLHPLIDHVRSAGMDFGLWVEPEMVNEDSDLAREHPDWVLRGRAGLPVGWRHQQVLDLQVPEAYAHVRDALLALLDEYDIAFLKWDHNRDLIDAGHAARPAVHGQTLAFYRLLDGLRAAHPGLEIESCASGGGRIDLGVLARTDRVWPSDTIDAVERQRIQRWTGLLVPPEMLGTHVGGLVAHTTGRTLGLGFRAATALLGHFGIEWDLTMASDAERAEMAAWVALHKRIRPLVASGRVVRGEAPDPAVVVSGVVAPDGGEGWYVVATVATVVTQSLAPVVLPGLDPTRRYRISCETPGGQRHTADLGESWVDGDPVEVGGSVLGTVGVRLPVMAPEEACVIRAVALTPEG
ncbi:alpha-galactosidase [Nocardioides psychrotolerans]|uniref:Alpha-galactosidase n=1 Tax=Nocardioides psychrotolerans TaxID=1005945 RepID=A0A1I3FZH3_9ACTN|nr:alpha-galactosidase [Nocardioides psychrotolerans]GEP37391.1 alpha-galactosidase [Nocardioides psychrotolerans]SFI16625.1 alpha-galactosidase [Nocardioides psychrotolerans]